MTGVPSAEAGGGVGDGPAGTGGGGDHDRLGDLGLGG